MSCQSRILSTNGGGSSHLKIERYYICYLRVEIKNTICHEDK